MSSQKKKGIFLIIKAGLAAYVFIIFLIIHMMHVRMEAPYLDLNSLITRGLVDMVVHPTRLFPIPPGTFQAILSFTFFGAVTIMLVYLVAKTKESKDPASGKWMKDTDSYNRRFSEPFGKTTHEGTNNMILSRDLFMSMDNRKIHRNMNVFVIGGSGSGKSFNFVGPNIMQSNCSYIITDPSGDLYRDYASFLEYKGYKIKCFNLSHMDKGNHYNPFRYIHSDKDIEVLVTTLISNTTPPEKHSGDPFWEKSETALLVALIAYLYHNTDKGSQNFSSVMQLMRAADINEDDSSMKSPLDYIFEQAENDQPDSFAVKQYKTFKMGAGRTLKGILISCAVRLQAFDLKDVADLTDTDDIDLDVVGDEKTALFIIVPTGDRTFNFLAAMMYSQLFQRTYDYCENTAEFSQLVIDGDGQLVRTYRAASPDEMPAKKAEAEAFLERAKNGKIRYNEQLEWYEILTSENELVGYRGSQQEAEKAFALIQEAKVVGNGRKRLPIHTRMLLDEFANIGKIPEFDQKVATIRKYEISTTIILQSLAQMQKLYKDDWSDIAGNCDSTIYLGGGTDTVTTKWVSELLGKETRMIKSEQGGKSGGSTSRNRQAIELYAPAELRTMDENDCIVILKSLDAYKGKKYIPFEHPQWELVNSLPKYYFNEEKKNKILQASMGIPEEEEQRVPEEEHGGKPVVDEMEREQVDMQDEEQVQKAEEMKKNMDAEKEPVIAPPSPVNEKNAKFIDAVSTEPRTGKKQIQEREKSMDTSNEAWGLDELVFGSAPRDGTNSS